MGTTLQEIFRSQFSQYAQQRPLHPRERRAAWAIMNCRTPVMGGHILSCPHDDYRLVQYHSCRHRSCPTCSQQPRQHWVQQQLQRLLPCEHYHAVFTLPHEFIALWAYNRAALSKLLFDCARESLLQLCRDERFLGATPGIIMALHTWGRTLSQHPHVHCLVTGGGLDTSGQWRPSHHGYLLPVKVLSSLFRGKVLHHIKHAVAHATLRLPPQQDTQHWLSVIKAQYRKHWNVQLAEPYQHGRGVALYLARYVKGGALGSRHSFDTDAHSVRFDYVDHRDGQRKQLQLSKSEFIARVLWHAPPRGQHTVRHAGLYASSAAVPLEQARQQLAPPPIIVARTVEVLAFSPTSAPRCLHCPQCNANLIPAALIPKTHHPGEISNYVPPTARTPLGPTRRSSGHPGRATFQRPGFAVPPGRRLT
jgi:hypothetical protein